MGSFTGPRIAQALFGVVLILLGAYFLGYGLWLAWLGDTAYYAVVGLLMVLSGIQLLRGKSSAFPLYAAAWVITLVWSLWEVGLSPWGLEVRLFAPSVLLAAFLIPWIATLSRPLYPRFWRGFQAASAVVGVLLVGCVVYASYGPASGTASQVAARQTSGPTDWPHYGRDTGDARYADIAQITPSNVDQLEVAWTASNNDPADPVEVARKGREYHAEATPIKVGNVLYTCTTHSTAFAMDATTGKVLWRFDPKFDHSLNAYLVCRGVSYYDASARTASCAKRIFLPTLDAHIYAINAETGEMCDSFGDHGKVSLKDQTGASPNGWQVSTSAPLVMNDRLVVGERVIDNMAADEPSGLVRAYDPVDGHQIWAWDVGRSENALPGRLPEGEVYTRGTPNVWGTVTGDAENGIVYLSTGNAAPDYYIAHRRPFDDRFGSAIVALNVADGSLRWVFQTVHRDMWDFDLPIGPSLFTTQDGQPALIQTTKTGQIFMLNRLTGKPIAAVEERPVDQAGAPAEVKVSPTQPFSTGMPSLTPAQITPQDTWGATPIDQLACRVTLAQARHNGIYTPIGPTPSIGNPAFDGVTDWGGASIDTQKRMMYVNIMQMPFWFQLVDRNSDYGKELLRVKSSGGENASKLDVRIQENTPYLATLRAWLSPFMVPCVPPPWGEILGINLDTKKIDWRSVLGTARDNGPFGTQTNIPLPTGTPNLGGSIVTAGGLVFIGATTDQYIRAYDAQTGNEVWKHRLNAAATAMPLTYVGEDGRQYVVITAGGHGALGTRYGDETIAFALPRRG